MGAPSTQSSVEAKVFRGQHSDVDPQDLPAGAAQVQRNLQIVRAGEMEVRKGFRKVVFED